jgi:hypothetical protein
MKIELKKVLIPILLVLVIVLLLLQIFKKQEEKKSFDFNLDYETQLIANLMKYHLDYGNSGNQIDISLIKDKKDLGKSYSFDSIEILSIYSYELKGSFNQFFLDQIGEGKLTIIFSKFIIHRRNSFYYETWGPEPIKYKEESSLIAFFGGNGFISAKIDNKIQEYGNYCFFFKNEINLINYNLGYKYLPNLFYYLIYIKEDDTLTFGYIQTPNEEFYFTNPFLYNKDHTFAIIKQEFDYSLTIDFNEVNINDNVCRYSLFEILSIYDEKLVG